MLDQVILELISKNKLEYDKVLEKIENNDKIVLFRHQSPDFDALGTQLGLYHWLKDNYPNKEVHVVGENHVTLTPRLYEGMEIYDTWSLISTIFIMLIYMLPITMLVIYGVLKIIITVRKKVNKLINKITGQRVVTTTVAIIVIF